MILTWVVVDDVCEHGLSHLCEDPAVADTLVRVLHGKSHGVSLTQTENSPVEVGLKLPTVPGPVTNSFAF